MTIKIYVHKYVRDIFLEQKDIFHDWIEKIVSYVLFLYKYCSFCFMQMLETTSKYMCS